MAKFLQDTVGEMAKEVRTRRSGDIRKTAEELQKFLTKVGERGREGGERQEHNTSSLAGCASKLA